jgi:rhodanese-related sulfurtransferase
MTMPESQALEPDAGATIRGAMLILVVGTALGIGYNAMGLASKPRHGLAWIKTPEKIASLESLLSAPIVPAAPAGRVEVAPAEAPGAGDAAAATEPTPPNPAPAAGATAAPADSTATKSATAHPDSTHAKSATKKSTKKSSASHSSTTAKSAGAASATKAGATQKPAASAASSAAAQKPTTPAASPASTPAAAAAPAAGAATGAAASAPADLPNIPDVTGPLKVELATFKKLYDANAALVVDAREAQDYTDGHIKGALSIPYNDAMADPDKVKKLDPAGRPIVVYCSGGDCELSMDLAKVMVENGKRKVLVYEGGFPEWERSNLPITKGANP